LGAISSVVLTYIGHKQTNRQTSYVYIFSLGINIASNAKPHSERGWVERRIRVLRETLKKIGEQKSVPMTCGFPMRISNTIDNSMLIPEKGEKTWGRRGKLISATCCLPWLLIITL